MYARVPLPGKRRRMNGKDLFQKCYPTKTDASPPTSQVLAFIGSDALESAMRMDMHGNHFTSVDSGWQLGPENPSRQHTSSEIKLAVQALDVLTAACMLRDPDDADAVCSRELLLQSLFLLICQAAPNIQNV